MSGRPTAWQIFAKKRDTRCSHGSCYMHRPTVWRHAKFCTANQCDKFHCFQITDDIFPKCHRILFSIRYNGPAVKTTLKIF